MTDYNNNSDVYNPICEAEGCSAKATNEIKAKAGPQKVISLLLCNDCVSKFQEVTQTC